MKSFLNFFALIALAFALGAGAAWLRQPHGDAMPPAEVAPPPPLVNPKSLVGKNPQAIQAATGLAGAPAVDAVMGAATPAVPPPAADGGKTSDSEGGKTSDADGNKPASANAGDAGKTPPADGGKTPAADGGKASDSDGGKTPAADGGKTSDSDGGKTSITDSNGVPTFTLTQAVTAVTGAGQPQAGKQAPKTADPVIPTSVGGAFSLVDHNGNDVSEKSWPGKYLLVFFGFTHCPDICPVTLDKLTSVLDALGPEAAKVQTLYITVDPLRDTAPVMKEYVSHFHKSMLGLTGSEQQVKSAEDAFKVYAERTTAKNGSDYSFDHSAFAYFMTPDDQLAEVIKVDDKPTEITERIKPWLEGTKKLPTP